MANPIELLYDAAFHRPADAAGLAYWENSGWATPQIAAWFASSPEFVGRYGALTDDGYVRQLYENILGRDGEQSGITYWDSKLAQGVSRGDILNGFAQSPEHQAHLTAPVPDPPAITPTPPVTTLDPPQTPPTNETPPTVPSNDIVGSADNQTLNVTGFLHPSNVRDFATVNVGTFQVDTGGGFSGTNGTLKVDGTLSGALNVNSTGIGSSSAEIGQGAPDGAINLATWGSGPLATLILDHAPDGHLPNAVIGSGRGGIIELPGLVFDGEKFTTSDPTKTSGSGQLFAGGTLDLTLGGVPVFRFDSWHPSQVAGNGVGVDPVTGYHFVGIG